MYSILALTESQWSVCRRTVAESHFDLRRTMWAVHCFECAATLEF